MDSPAAEILKLEPGCGAWMGNVFAGRVGPGWLRPEVGGTRRDFVLTCGGRTVGFGAIAGEGGCAECGYSLVREFAGGEIAFQCIRAVENFARALGVKRLVTVVEEEDSGVVRALERAGHRQIEWVEMNI